MATALVTGATAGIGAVFARQLAGRGHDLVLVARDEARLQESATALRDRGVQVEVLVADLAAREDLGRVAARVGDRRRPVDLLVNNAGFGLSTRVVDGDLDELDRAHDVMVRAVLHLSSAAVTAMRERGRGAVINVSSVAGYVPMGTYSAIKAWVTTFSEGLAVELAGSGVTVTALCPGFVRTEFHDRAGLTMSHMPGWAYVDVESLVRTALADAAAGRVVSVPSLRYRALVAALPLAPRGLVRRVAGAISGSRHRPA